MCLRIHNRLKYVHEIQFIKVNLFSAECVVAILKLFYVYMEIRKYINVLLLEKEVTNYFNTFHLL